MDPALAENTGNLLVRPKLLAAPYIPLSGLNEWGLAVSTYLVPHAEPPRREEKPFLFSLGAIRLVLDYAKNVAEAIHLLQQYNIYFPRQKPFQILLADASGRSVLIEWIDGKLMALPNRENWQVATNFIQYGAPSADFQSCWRYQKTYRRLAGLGGSINAQEAMQILSEVSRPTTQWSIVCHLASGIVELVPGRDYARVYKFQLPVQK